MGDATQDVAVAASVRSKLRATGESGAFLLVRVAGQRDPAPPKIVEAVRQAVLVANAGVPPRTVIGDFVTATTRGTAVSVFWNGSVEDASREWLTALSDALRSVGLAGKVGTSGTWAPGIDAVRRVERTYPTAFVAYQLSEYIPLTEPLRGWQVDRRTTRRIAGELQAWGFALPDTEPWAVLPAACVPILPTESTSFLCQTAELAPRRKSVLYVRRDRSGYHDTTFYDLGQCVTQSVLPTGDWRGLLDAQIKHLLLAPEAADVGMIKSVGTLAASWMDTDIRWRSLHRTVRLPLDYHRNRHLWDEYVIDAAGVSLLTDRHLAHAHDLSDWRIEEVAPNRFLVTADNLETWFGGLAPDPETIRKARHDFGDMILSWDVILSRPGPYTVTDPSIVGR